MLGTPVKGNRMAGHGHIRLVLNSRWDSGMARLPDQPLG